MQAYPQRFFTHSIKSIPSLTFSFYEALKFQSPNSLHFLFCYHRRNRKSNVFNVKKKKIIPSLTHSISKKAIILEYEERLKNQSCTNTSRYLCNSRSSLSAEMLGEFDLCACNASHTSTYNLQRSVHLNAMERIRWKICTTYTKISLLTILFATAVRKMFIGNYGIWMRSGGDTHRILKRHF